MRSLLFVPGYDFHKIENGLNSDADVLLLDLEDSVKGMSAKEDARRTIFDFFVGADRSENKAIYPRINDRESGYLLKDLLSLAPLEAIDGFMYPKAQDEEDIFFIDKLLETIEYENHLEIGRFKLIPLIETPSAILNVDNICRASDRITAIALGGEDLLAGTMATEQIFYFARTQVSLAARANNIIPIDTVHPDIHNLEDLENNLKTAKCLGFEGMLCLHPKEIPLVHQYYTSTPEEIEQAKQLLATFEQEKMGVSIQKSGFLGPPAVKMAKKILKYEI